MSNIMINVGCTTMDFFQHRYYRLNRMFMQLIGQWPYQSTRLRYSILTSLLLFAATYLIPQIMAIVKKYDDWNYLMLCVEPLLFGAFCIVKLFTCVLNSHKMLMLLNHIRTDWKVWAQDRDVEVLHEYTEKGRYFTVLFTVVCYVTCTIFVVQPVIPKIIDVLLKNGTEPGQFPIPIDYHYIDMQKYYFYIILHTYVYGSLGFTIALSYDCLFSVSVLHGCGLFAALGRHLQRIGRSNRSAERGEIVDASKQSDMEMTHLRWCIKRHSDAIEFAELIEAINSSCFFVISGINMLLISMLGLEIVKKSVDREQSIRFAFTNILGMMHLYLDNYMAQMLMDHSISIRYHIWESEWYNLPSKTQKTLLFIMMRCDMPCNLTAGKMAIMSIETFTVFLKTSLSYFTLLRSV